MNMNIGDTEVGAPEMTDTEMDSVLNAERPSTEIPMTAAPQAPTTPQEYTIKVNDREIKAPLEKVLQWAQLGYQYPQKAGELNKQQQEMQARQAELEKQRQEYEQKFTPYKEVDEYAAKNPDWWAQVQAQYKQKLAGATSNPEVEQLKAELADLKKFRDDYNNEKQNKQIQEQDSKLSQEVESIRKQYSNIDFETPDADGLNLEMKILKHAQEENLPNFRVAFRDYYHEYLTGKAKEEGKELVTKEVQKRTKLGILGESSKPTKGLKVAENPKNKSYNDLKREAMEELGIA